MGLLAQWRNNGRWRSEFWAPASASDLAECEASTGPLPKPASSLLLESNGAILAITTADPANSGLHILSTNDMRQLSPAYRQAYSPHLNDLILWAKTPGPGAFYLAMTHGGAIVDLFGYPDRAPTEAGRFPLYRGEWQVIASSVEELLARMLAQDTEPLYWL